MKERQTRLVSTVGHAYMHECTHQAWPSRRCGVQQSIHMGKRHCSATPHSSLSLHRINTQTLVEAASAERAVCRIIERCMIMLGRRRARKRTLRLSGAVTDELGICALTGSSKAKQPQTHT
jgi:hypothetical protein